MLSRSAVVIVGVGALLTLSACGGSSPSPPSSASPSPPIADLTTLATHFGAQQAWWMALTRAEAGDLVHDMPDVSPAPSEPIFVVLMRGDFNDASGKPMTVVPNKRVNLTRRSADSFIMYRRTRRLRAMRWTQRGGG